MPNWHVPIGHANQSGTLHRACAAGDKAGQDPSPSLSQTALYLWPLQASVSPTQSAVPLSVRKIPCPNRNKSHLIQKGHAKGRLKSSDHLEVIIFLADPGATKPAPYDHQKFFPISALQHEGLTGVDKHPKRRRLGPQTSISLPSERPFSRR